MDNHGNVGYTRRRQTKHKTQDNMCWIPSCKRQKSKDKQNKGTICVGNNTVEVCLYFLSYDS